MPHIKVSTQSFEAAKPKISSLPFVCCFAKHPKGGFWQIGIADESCEFLIECKMQKESVLIKYDKTTRPLDVALIKRYLALLAKELGWEIKSDNIAHSATKPKLASAFQKEVKDFEGIDFEGRSVVLEVGFGSGRHLLYQAQKEPQRLHIGIEIHTPSAQQLLRQIELMGLENIWVVNYDARLILEMLPSSSLERIFVHFPVPWDKKPHRRVISKAFIEESMRVLSSQGVLELRTDSDNYFEYSKELFLEPKFLELSIYKNRPLEVVSKYEQRWLKQNKNIYELHLKKIGADIPKAQIGEFLFDGLTYSKEYAKLPTKPFVFEGYFVHIERYYEMHDGALVKVALGSFDRPEHKYLYIDSKSCRYMVSNPVATTTNFKAHMALVKILKRGDCE